MALVTAQIQIRRDTKAAWDTENPTLLAGELGLETDTTVLKMGDGVTPWIALSGQKTQWTAKSIAFVNAQGILTENTARFQWDDTVGNWCLLLDKRVTYNVDDVITADAVYQGDPSYGMWDDSGSYPLTFEFDIIAYINTPIGRVYSANRKRVTCDTQGTGDFFRVQLTWTAVAGADGYKIIIYNDPVQGWEEGDEGYGIDVGTATSLDYDPPTSDPVNTDANDSPKSGYGTVSGDIAKIYGDINHAEGDITTHGDISNPDYDAQLKGFRILQLSDPVGTNFQVYYTTQYSPRLRFSAGFTSEPSVAHDFVVEYMDNQNSNVGRTIFQLGKSGQYGFQFMGYGSAYAGTFGGHSQAWPIARLWTLQANDRGALALLASCARSTTPGPVILGWGDPTNNPASLPWTEALWCVHTPPGVHVALPASFYDKVVRLNNVPLASSSFGVPGIVDVVTYSSWGADIVATNFANSSTAGLYRVSWMLWTAVVDASSCSAVLELVWNDGIATRALADSEEDHSRSLKVAGISEGTILIPLASGTLQWRLDHNFGDWLTGRVSFRIVCERIS